MTADGTPDPTIDVLVSCFMYFVNHDRMNASIHGAEVRYSPITFRLAEALEPAAFSGLVSMYVVGEVERILGHKGLYEEDRGR